MNTIATFKIFQQEGPALPLLVQSAQLLIDHENFHRTLWRTHAIWHIQHRKLALEAKDAPLSAREIDLLVTLLRASTSGCYSNPRVASGHNLQGVLLSGEEHPVDTVQKTVQGAYKRSIFDTQADN